jgi:hypothetical protein
VLDCVWKSGCVKVFCLTGKILVGFACEIGIPRGSSPRSPTSRQHDIFSIIAQEQERQTLQQEHHHGIPRQPPQSRRHRLPVARVSSPNPRPKPDPNPSNTSHSVYSAYEHSLLASASSSPTLRLPTEAEPKLNLPIDIALETLFSVLLLCVGVVLSSPDLKPIQWSAWAGNLERSKEARVLVEAGVAPGNPYAQLEDRPGFWDPRGARKAFGMWVKDGPKSS